MFKGNRLKVDNDAIVIAERLRAGTATITGLCREYSCAYSTMMRTIFTQMPKKEYRKLAIRKKTKIRHAKRQAIQQQKIKEANLIAIDARDRTLAEQGLSQFKTNEITIRQCVSCSWDVEHEGVVKCPKCGCITFETFRQKNMESINQMILEEAVA